MEKVLGPPLALKPQVACVWPAQRAIVLLVGTILNVETTSSALTCLFRRLEPKHKAGHGCFQPPPTAAVPGRKEDGCYVLHSCLAARLRLELRVLLSLRTVEGSRNFSLVFSGCHGWSKHSRERRVLPSSAPPSYVTVQPRAYVRDPSSAFPSLDVRYLNELMQQPLFSPETCPTPELFRPVAAHTAPADFWTQHG